MRIDTSHSLPALLMISDCLPDPEGGSRASRAWRLLCCAASTHEVTLSVQTDQPVNLEQWRRVAVLAKQVHMESARGSLFQSSRLLHGPSLHTKHQRFHTVLLTSPQLWSNQDKVVADLRLCDFACIETKRTRVLPRKPGLIERLTGKPLLRRRTHHSRSSVAAGCDRLLVAKAPQKDRLPKGRSRAVVISDSGEIETWMQMLMELQLKQSPAPADYITPEVKVMPVQPMSRKAA